MTGPSASGPLGLLLVDKIAGVTSHDVVGRVRAIMSTRRVGHAGTLDPMATGLLVLAVGRATKLLGRLALRDKQYLATIRLGAATDTDDATGTRISGGDASGLTAQDITAAMMRLTGAIDQVPSSYSAIKVHGRRAYDLARAGEEVRLAARPVVITRFELTAAPVYDASHIDLAVAVDCSAGTYIRALARDLGDALGVGAHLTTLRRTRVGPFDVHDAIDVFPDGVTPPGAARPPISDRLRARAADGVIPVDAAARLAFDVREIDPDEAREVRHGRPIAPAGIAGCYAAVDEDGALLALLQESDGRARTVLGWAAAG